MSPETIILAWGVAMFIVGAALAGYINRQRY